VPPEAQAHFTSSSMLEEIQQSNEMEQVQSTRREIREAMEDMQNEASDKRFLGMVRKYAMLIVRKEVPLRSSTDVRRLYDEFLLDEVILENPDNAPDGLIFRSGTVGVVSKHDRMIHRGLSPETTIIETMDQALAMLHDPEMDLLIRVAAFHYAFGYIHPFYDGNGRMTRFISSYMLSERYERAACLRIAYIIKEHRSAYQQMFKDANDARSMGDLTRFVIDFLCFFREALDDAYASLDVRWKNHQYYEKLLERFIHQEKAELAKHAAMLQQMLVVELFGCAGLSVRQLAARTNLSLSTVRSVMKRCGSLVRRTREGQKDLWHINLQTLDELAEGKLVDEA